MLITLQQRRRFLLTWRDWTSVGPWTERRGNLRHHGMEYIHFHSPDLLVFLHLHQELFLLYICIWTAIEWEVDNLMKLAPLINLKRFPSNPHSFYKRETKFGWRLNQWRQERNCMVDFSPILVGIYSRRTSQSLKEQPNNSISQQIKEMFWNKPICCLNRRSLILICQRPYLFFPSENTRCDMSNLGMYTDRIGSDRIGSDFGRIG